jgi:hypothetical protein
VVLLAVEGRVRQHTVVADNQRRLCHRRAELGRVVGRSKADGGRREEMASRVNVIDSCILLLSLKSFPSSLSGWFPS